MDATIDKFGRILIPKKIRQLLRLSPGQKVRLMLDDSSQVLELHVSEEASLQSSKVKISASGLPVIMNGNSNSRPFDTTTFIEEGRIAELDKKMGLS